MRRMRILSAWVIVAGVVACPAVAEEPAGQAAAAFELRDGDRVVLLGNTLIEREQQSGHWESLLTARFADRNVTFRNLGWDGDTVWAESRGLFDSPQQGYQRMLEQLRALQPTVVMLGYGGNEAFAGETGLPRFVGQLDKLLDDLRSLGVRTVVILSPVRHERHGPPLPDPAPHNRNLERYTEALRATAARRGLPLVDLFSTVIPPETGAAPK